MERARTRASGVHDPMRYARATHRIARVITTDFEAETIREAMVQIIGETLDVDRTLIYDIRFDEQVAEGLCEWLNPDAEGVEPTIATYPLAVFGSAADLMAAQRCRLESYASEVHPAIAADGADVILHEQMKIKSLLWFPFDFEPGRYQALIFNQVRHERRWSPDDLAFVESVAELVSTAHLRIRLEAEREQIARRAEQRARLASLGLLARGVAHDFNNLLTAILGNATMLGRRLDREGDEAIMVASITEAAESAAAMCQQLLDYSGDTSSALLRLDLNAVVESVLSALSASLAVEVVRELSPETVAIHGDATALSQVVLNLLTNASAAAAPTSARVTVRTGVRARQAFLEVEDGGVGMDEATQARMFEAFFTTGKKGHGLGLAGVPAALAQHQATIDVQSAPGKGTRVCITFPSLRGEAMGAGREALLVDPDRMVRQLCVSALALEGYAVTSLSAAGDVLERCLAEDAAFDLLVLDAGAEPDAPATLEALREAGLEIPIVVIGTTPGADVSKREGEARWAYLEKPFSPARLLEAVAEARSR